MTAPRPCVLLVEDDLHLSRSLDRVLKCEMDLFLVKNGLEALQVVVSGARFGVILSDLKMPVMSGIQLFHELEQVAPDQADRMIFITGDSLTPTAARFLAGVTNLWLEKPFSPATLRGMIRRQLQERRAA